MARSVSLRVIAFVMFLATSFAFGQQIDPTFYGVWTLNVAKSDFGSRPKPKMGEVNWTKEGWVFALVTSDERLFADGVVTGSSCALIGNAPGASCEFKVVTPRHVNLTIRQGETVRVLSDIELIDDNTTKTTHRMTPSRGSPFVQHTIWERAAPK
jgi:hypothetical protein